MADNVFEEKTNEYLQNIINGDIEAMNNLKQLYENNKNELYSILYTVENKNELIINELKKIEDDDLIFNIIKYKNNIKECFICNENNIHIYYKNNEICLNCYSKNNI